MAKKKASKAPESESPESPTTPPAPKTFQAFERATAMRSQLRFHESNPRSINSSAAKKLRESVRRGLVSGICINRRTADLGFPASQVGQLTIVGGHQRVKVMDDLSGYDPATGEGDYQIPVDIITVSPAREREVLISLNNQSLQGSYDLDTLSDLLTFPDLDWKATGFDKLELRAMLDSGICDQILGEESPQSAAEAPVIDAIAAIAADSKEFSKARDAAQNPATPAGQVSPSLTGNPTIPPASQTAPPAQGDDINSVENIKGRRYDFRDKIADAGSEAHLTLVANDSDELENLLLSLGLPVNQPFVMLDRFMDALSGVTGLELGDLIGGEELPTDEDSAIPQAPSDSPAPDLPVSQSFI